MFTSLCRWLAAGSAAVITLAGPVGPATSSAAATTEPLRLPAATARVPKLPASTSTCGGVWVVVDRGQAESTVRCATTYSTGLAALKSAGFKVEAPGGFVSRIHGFPTRIDTSYQKYWGYWHASPNPDGTWGPWKSSTVGAGAARPKKGDAEGWFYGPYTESASFNLPPSGYRTAPVPVITGKARVGRKLTVTKGNWKPSPGKLKVQWYRSGKAIKGATKTTYRLTTADARKVITVKVTASGKGLQTLTRSSAPTAKVTR